MLVSNSFVVSSGLEDQSAVSIENNQRYSIDLATLSKLKQTPCFFGGHESICSKDGSDGILDSEPEVDYA